MSNDHLTTLEMRIVHLIAAGSTNRAIGQALGYTENTIRTYIREIYTKVGVSSRTELITHFFDLHLKVEFVRAVGEPLL